MLNQYPQKFSDNDQVMRGYDMNVPGPISKFQAAAFIDFENNKMQE